MVTDGGSGLRLGKLALMKISRAYIRPVGLVCRQLWWWCVARCKALPIHPAIIWEVQVPPDTPGYYLGEYKSLPIHPAIIWGYKSPRHTRPLSGAPLPVVKSPVPRVLLVRGETRGYRGCWGTRVVLVLVVVLECVYLSVCLIVSICVYLHIRILRVSTWLLIDRLCEEMVCFYWRTLTCLVQSHVDLSCALTPLPASVTHAYDSVSFPISWGEIGMK